MARDPVRDDFPTPLQPGHARRDWTARVRSSVLDAQRYSKFVILMKRLLTISAVGIILAVLAFFFVARQPRQLSLSYESMGKLENDMAMIKPRLSGVDAKGKPFVITADTAIQEAGNPHRATLKTIEADMSLDKEGWFNARAARGTVDMDKGKLELTGGIAIFSDNGYELHTERAAIDLKAGLARGPGEISGRGPHGTIRADHFNLDRTAGLLTLEGNVRTTLIGKAQ